MIERSYGLCARVAGMGAATPGGHGRSITTYGNSRGQLRRLGAIGHRALVIYQARGGHFVLRLLYCVGCTRVRTYVRECFFLKASIRTRRLEGTYVCGHAVHMETLACAVHMQ